MSNYLCVLFPEIVYFQLPPVADSPESLGYTFDMTSGLWYKLHDVNADYVTARSTCESEGASLVTLDTEAKLVLFYTPGLLQDRQCNNNNKIIRSLYSVRSRV